MIRINLLTADAKAAVKKPGLGVVLANQRMAIGCTAILIIAVGLIGWRYLTLTRQSAALDAEIAAAQQETARLHSVIQQVQVFEQRRAQLQQRVGLIEQLRKAQTGPVHMLDQVSRALPPMVWLTELKQDAKSADDVLIDGRCINLTSLSDFVANLEATGYFKKSIEIVSTVAESLPQPPGELIKFSVRAQFQAVAPPKPAAPGTPAGSAPAPPARTGGN